MLENMVDELLMFKITNIGNMQDGNDIALLLKISFV